jgi:uracil-DNA glycosylase
MLSVDKYDYKDWDDTYGDSKCKLSDLHTDVGKWDLMFESLYKKALKKDYIIELENELNAQIQATKGKTDIYPYPRLVFNTFKLCKFEDLKCCVISQDPYINTKDGVPEAMGLAFSVPLGVKTPPSLKNIYLNMKKFGHITDIPDHGNLETWASQGVLLLNSALTVQAKISNSHQKIWAQYTNDIIEYISKNCDNVIFMLWGKDAYNKRKLIDETRHQISVSTHPSPFSFDKKASYADAFMNVDHFGLCKTIKWDSILD